MAETAKKGVSIDDVQKWLDKADKIFNTPIVRNVLWPQLKAVLPTLGLKPAQIAQLDARYADLQVRRDRARRRARP